MHILLLIIFLNAIANYRERWNKGFCSKIMKGTAKGLTFLHNFSPKKCVHGELKPNDVLHGLNMNPTYLILQLDV